MATDKPRITVTLPPHHHEVLSRLSGLSGDSMSKIIAGFVELAVPSLERVVVVLERARDAPKEARAGLRAAIERADRDLMPLLQAAAVQTDLFLADAQSAAVADLAAATDAQRPAEAPGQGAARKARMSQSGGRTPGAVTRGSGPRKVTNRGRP